MTEEQLDLLVDYIHEKLSALRLEIKGDAPYWADKQADRIHKDLLTTITGEQTNE